MSKFLPILLLFLLCACNNDDIQNTPTTQVKHGTFTEELTEEGSIQSVNAIFITTPRVSYRYGALKIASIIEDGTEVMEGDTVLVFDPTELKKAIINAEQKLEIAQAEFEKMKATQESEIEDLEADLEITQISLEISRINFTNARFESEITKKEINLQLKTSEISLERAKEQIDNKKRIHKEELLQKKLGMNQLIKTLEEANATMSSLFVVSPSNGIAIVKDNWMTGQKWQVGEQPYSRYPIIDLPDLRHMMTEVKINEVDVSKVRPGLEVEIISDAYSDTSYTGKISHVANLAQPKDRNSKIKVFPVKILIDGENNKLLPGLTVSCKIKVNEIKDILYLPVESIFEEYGNPYVYLKAKSGFKRQDIQTGDRNTDFVVILQGLSDGDEVALSDPFVNKQENTQ
ncbi:MAG: efflux RND transporter periplasmic adaptor subunit [Bacteroidota bacterium]|nr:efflux RND transporter periplasmic adaptor subunit [Bacteroidota bacterium]